MVPIGADLRLDLLGYQVVKTYKLEVAMYTFLDRVLAVIICIILDQVIRYHL